MNTRSLRKEPEDSVELFKKVSRHINHARQSIYQSVNIEMVKAYWSIGQDIVLHEQKGDSRAEYGKFILKDLSCKLQAKYKRGFSVDILERARRFYSLYPSIFEPENSATVSRKSSISILQPNLSWSHYTELLKEGRDEARSFYAVEASSNHWSIRELRRQMSSFLYDRLLKSKNKDQVTALSQVGQEIKKPGDAIKDPLVLEFIGAPESGHPSETELEKALVENLQQFLLELGKGFAFIGSQKRLSFDNQHLYADLVFYHVILKCYVVIDIKSKPLTHGDLGQIQLYVNYFDKEMKKHNDNPTIGIVLCTQKSDRMVEYFLGNNQKIFTSTYQFHLPTIDELETELKRELKEIKQDITDTPHR